MVWLEKKWTETFSVEWKVSAAPKQIHWLFTNEINYNDDSIYNITTTKS